MPNQDSPSFDLQKEFQSLKTFIEENRTGPARRFSMANYSYKVIMDRIKEFEDELDNEHEVGIKLASFGQSITMSVTEIGYSNPSTLIFYGFVGNQPATLIQHMSQLNFLLLAMEKSDPEKPPRRIGFNADWDAE